MIKVFYSRRKSAYVYIMYLQKYTAERGKEIDHKSSLTHSISMRKEQKVLTRIENPSFILFLFLFHLFLCVECMQYKGDEICYV